MSPKDDPDKYFLKKRMSEYRQKATILFIPCIHQSHLLYEGMEFDTFSIYTELLKKSFYKFIYSEFHKLAFYTRNENA